MLIAIISLLIVCLLNVILGSASLDFSTLLDSQIFWQLRLPRTLTALVAGGTLALAGHLTQILFRNSLATPYTLGIASSAGLGAILAMSLGLNWAMVGSFSLVAAVIVIVVLSLAHLKASMNSNTLLLLGIAINLFCGALISVLQITSGKLDLAAYLGWVMGSVSVVGFEVLFYITPPFILLLVSSIVNARNLSIIAIEGDSYTRGFDPRIIRFYILSTISISIAVLVSKLGPIGFIGLVIPHLSIRVFDSQEKQQIWGCIVLGGLSLVVADFINRTVLSGLGLPVGVITTAIGAPALAFIVWKNR